MLKNLKKLRMEKRISQKQLGDAISVTQQSINKYENHNIEPDIQTMIRIAFNTSVDYLIGHSEVRRKIENVQTYDLNQEGAELIKIYRTLTRKEKRAFI